MSKYQYIGWTRDPFYGGVTYIARDAEDNPIGWIRSEYPTDQFEGDSSDWWNHVGVHFASRNDALFATEAAIRASM